MIPSGCSPPVFAMFPDAAPAEYDPRTGCLEAQNELGRRHNALLQASLRELRAEHPHARILYADFFGPVMEMVESPRKFGQCTHRRHKLTKAHSDMNISV